MEWIPPRTPQGALLMWTIYDHPKDYPNGYIARLWLVQPGMKSPLATGEVFKSPWIETIRDAFTRHGFTCIPRSDHDDPVIVETWLP